MCRQPQEYQVGERAGKHANQHRAQNAEPRDAEASQRHAGNQRHHAEDLAHLGYLGEGKAQIQIKRPHEVQHKIRQAIQADQRQNERPEPGTKAGEEIAQRFAISRLQMNARAGLHAGQRQTCQSQQAKAEQHRRHLQIDTARHGSPGDQQCLTRLRRGAEQTHYILQQHRISRKPGAHDESRHHNQRQPQRPFQEFSQRSAWQITGKAAKRAGRYFADTFARREQDSHHADTHQPCHDSVGKIPAERLRQKQRHGPGHDHRQTIAPLIGSRHGAGAAFIHCLDPPGIDGDVLRRTGKTHKSRERADAPDAEFWARPGNQPQADDDQHLHRQHPRAALAEQAVEHRQTKPVDEWCPDKLERVTEGSERKDGNGLQRQAGLPQPDGERIEDQQKRQAGSKTKQKHDHGGTLTIDSQGSPRTHTDSRRCIPLAHRGLWQAQSLKLLNWTGTSRLLSRTSAMHSCKSSRFLPVTRSLSP